MKTRMPTNLFFLFCILTVLTSSGCGLRYHVKGQVVDAKTGKPVEGAAVAIKWYKRDWAPVFFGSSTTEIERAEDVTNEEGIFRIPKRPFRKHKMGVYKKGYICWNSNSEICFEEKPGYEVSYHGETSPGVFYYEKIGPEVKNGMEIKLEPLQEHMSEWQMYRHACFTSNIELICAPHNKGKSDFMKATRAEKELCGSKIQEK